MRPDDPLELADRAAPAGARVAVGWLDRAAGLRVEEKAGSHDLVSQADREAEQVVRDVLASAWPEDAVLGEEAGGSTGTTDVSWVVDPVDGITNYLYGRPDRAVSVAAFDDRGQVLAGVVVEPSLGRTTRACAGGGTEANGARVPRLTQNDRQRALVALNLGRPEQKGSAGRLLDVLVPRVRDVRRGGSAAVALAQVATGRADAAWVPGLRPWDCAAGILLVMEAGGTVGDLSGPSGGAVPASGDVLPPALWEPQRRLLQPVCSS